MVPLYTEGFGRAFNLHMSVKKYGSTIVCCTGKNLLFIDKAEIGDKLRGKPVITPYKGIIDKVKGTIFVIKRMC